MKCFKSGKQRRSEIKTARRQRRAVAVVAELPVYLPASRWVPVDPARLQPNNSYGQSDFVTRGFYLDRPFRCVDCGADCIWSAERQRWWYELAGGSQYSTARRCAACRDQERQRQRAARLAAGHAAKNALILRSTAKFDQK